ncbi:cytochrome c oxidase biogenesis protein Cmc1-like protein [Leucosporidium creatinivorum]|uniref:COX assembly mitochondrial protein n=1 Tax=Leucosporidium creatinivorum TaxID=106004 RepID=A0A1Y2FY53_9BASI|nr:cytochrome c oxidase biogenesis protein Cmc1-like protein [Leucosporidium creatinivorum]
MHPPLAEHAHTQCSEVMKAIKDCHTINPYLKFLGVCNDQKTALNMCLRKERQGRAVGNLEKAKAKRKEVEEKWKTIETEA